MNNMHQNSPESRIGSMNRVELFSDTSNIMLYERLEKSVFGRLLVERAMKVRKNMYFYGLLSGVSLLASAVTGEILHKSITLSGGYDFVSLFFTDTNVALNYSQDIFFVFVEALPVGTTLFAIITLSTLTYSSLKVLKLFILQKTFIKQYKY